jgi:Dyp-type peroxidase family
MAVAEMHPASVDLELEPVLDIHEIQGNSLAGFNKDYEMLLFLKITDVTVAKSWLCGIEPYIATVAEVLKFNRLFKETRKRRCGKEGTVRSTFINIAFSYEGLKKLTPDADQFTDEAFKAGLHNRSAALGDPTDPSSPGHPNNWLIGGPKNLPDMMVMVASDDRSRLDEEVKWLLATLPQGVSLMYKQRGETLPGALRGHEHFGFKDGISQPGIRGRLSDNPWDFLTLREDPADRIHKGKPGQDLLHPGEFIFGYATQVGKPAVDENGKEIDGLNHDLGSIAEAGPAWAKNGSYLVFRRLRQDVLGFHAFVKATAAALAQTSEFAGMTSEKFGAKLVGRWANGTPVSLSPNTDNPELSTSLNFEFERDDAEGFSCPFAGHVRKAYPRDTLRPKEGDGEKFVNESATQTRRLLRRGAPFGKPLAMGCPMRSFTSFAGLKELGLKLLGLVSGEKDDRGLLFLAYQTSITRQFEFVSQKWVNNPEFSDDHAGHDGILGQNGEGDRVRSVSLQAPSGQKSVPLPKDWVMATGGGYFFTPSMSGLKYLGGGVE